MIVLSCSLDSTLEQIKLQGSLRAVEERYQLFNNFDSVALLTQDTKDFSDELSHILHKPCGYSRFSFIRSVISRFSFIRWFFFSISSFFWLIKNKSKINLIISENVDTPIPFLFTMAFRIPYVIHYHYDLATQVSKVNNHFVEGLLLQFMDKLCFKRASSVWVTSPNLLKKVNNLGAKKAILIPNWVNFTETPKNRSRYKSFPENRIVFVGRLHPVKRVNLLIEAFGSLKSKYPNVSLLIVGDGEEREKLKKQTKDLNLDSSINFVGFQDHDHVLNLISQSNILVLPSIIEGNPRVLVEAMMLKVPIVATNVPGANDMIKHDVTGYLVNRASPEDLATAMNHLLINKEYSSMLAENAYEYAKQNFSKEQVLKKIAKDLTQLC
jgi:glycosyltransferase involved in cell wall biosynthesis